MWENFATEEDVPLITAAIAVSRAPTNEQFVLDLMAELLIFVNEHGDGATVVFEPGLKMAIEAAKKRTQKWNGEWNLG